MLHFNWILYDGNPLKQKRMSYFSANSIVEAMAHVERRLPKHIKVRDWLLNEDGYIEWWLIEHRFSGMVRLAFSPEAIELKPVYARVPREVSSL